LRIRPCAIPTSHCKSVTEQGIATTSGNIGHKKSQLGIGKQREEFASKDENEYCSLRSPNNPASFEKQSLTG
jgi:hypothetical protein